MQLELCGCGAGYLGDDMLMVNLDQKRVIPFATSINLKPDSWPLFDARYPSLKEISILNAETRPVKYFPFKPLGIQETYPAKGLLFPCFDEQAEGQLSPLNIDQVIELLSESGCYSAVSAGVEMSRGYLEFLLGLNAYRLTYSSSDQAIHLLRKEGLLVFK